MVNKGILRWSPGGPFSEAGENSPSDLDYSGPKEKKEEKKSTFVSIIQTIASALLQFCLAGLMGSRALGLECVPASGFVSVWKWVHFRKTGYSPHGRRMWVAPRCVFYEIFKQGLKKDEGWGQGSCQTHLLQPRPHI